jgi:O-antigen ligase
VLRIVSTLHIKVGGISRSSATILLIFVGIAGISIVPPILNSYDLMSAANLHLVTQTIYLGFGSIVAIFVAQRNSNMLEIGRSIKVYIVSSVFVSLWGIFQWIAYYVNIPYPAVVFNNSSTESAKGYLQVITEANITRISSVAVEPSILAKYLLTALPFLLFSIIFGYPILGLKRDKISIILLLAVSLMSTSTSAYFGIFILVIISTIVLFYMGLFRVRYLVYAVWALVGAAFAITFIPSVYRIVQVMILEKPVSYSAVERLTSVETAWNYFLDSPILGRGWGSVGSHDLVVRILSNAGLLGLLAFTALILNLFRQQFYGFVQYRRKKRPLLYSFGNTAVFISLFTLIVTNLATGLDFWFGHFWFIIGMSMATSVLIRKPMESNLSFAQPRTAIDARIRQGH